MKRLILCNDGTWNTPVQEENGIPAPTNVVKLYHAVAARDENGIEQRTYYHPGLGADGGLIDSIVGGAFGEGIDNHLRSAYHWLGTNYVPGDDIFIYGFSRGAFTARSLGGLIGRGLLDLRGLSSKEAWSRVYAAYDAYRREDRPPPAKWAKPDWAFFDSTGGTPIRFLGVWDTVGALGIPDDLEILNLFDDKNKWRFHDTTLGQHVATARHAMAMDEIRASFTVTRWENADSHRDAREVWFPGVHSDVGGGYSNTELSDGALRWMLEESKTAGLRFRPGVLDLIRPNSLGALHNSYKGIFEKLRSRPRAMEALISANKILFHSSAWERQTVSPIAYAAYRPSRILAVGESMTVDVHADTHWNDVGLYLDQGHRYVFSATGEWLDGKEACDWKGTENDNLTAGDIIRATGTFLGKFETVVKNITKNASTDFLGTKRVEQFPWYTLVGAIANDSGEGSIVPNDGSPDPHQYVNLPDHTTEPLVVDNPGYLYCFPNDAWSMYENNYGSVQLTITRKA
jgi:hypothetical protein